MWRSDLDLVCWCGLALVPVALQSRHRKRLCDGQGMPGCTQQHSYPLASSQVLFTRNCVYKSRTGNLKSGCAQYCNATMKVRRGQPGLCPGH